MLPQGLLFLKNRHFWKFQTCPFWKKYAFPYIWAYLVPIGPYLVPIWSLLGPIWSLFDPYWALFDPYLGPIWLYWALFGPIGPYWALFGSIGPYLALTVKQKRNTEGPDRGHRKSLDSTRTSGDINWSPQPSSATNRPPKGIEVRDFI